MQGITITGGNVVNLSGAVSNAVELTINNCHITGNFGTSGGGIRNTGTIFLNNSTVSNNTGEIGTGGIDNRGSMFINSSTISGNSKTANSPTNSGGGIYGDGTLTITNSTVTNNTSNGSAGAGGVYNEGGTVTLRNTIVAANVNNATKPDIAATGNTGFTSNGFNLIGNRGAIVATGNADQSGDGVIQINPLLGPLQNNGGTTPTHSLGPDSPATDSGNSSGSVNDQRGLGFLRVVDLMVSNAPGGDGADIGAFEVQTEPLLVFATVAGQVVTPAGIVLRNTRVTIIDAQNISQIATTTSFGTFTFSNVRVGETYTITVSSRRYRFAPKIMQINGNLANVNFTGLE